MSYTNEDYERECLEFEAKHGKKIYVGKPIKMPKWMRRG